MLETIRRQIINDLWQAYRNASKQMLRIEAALKNRHIHHYTLDHFAVIDLPSPQSGIAPLKELFQTIGFIMRGEDYLAEKQNDFAWLAQDNCLEVTAKEALPQVVVADFRLDEMPIEIKKIIEKYAAFTHPSPLQSIQTLLKAPDFTAKEKISALFLTYLSGRNWPLPHYHEFKLVQEFNELLAWVLIFGRKPNHFTLAAHLLPQLTDLSEFNNIIEQEAGLSLNTEGGKIKGNPAVGIEQSSTAGETTHIKLSDGSIELPADFVEFVWRFPYDQSQTNLWRDFYPDFVATHANRVIESLFVA